MGGKLCVFALTTQQNKTKKKTLNTFQSCDNRETFLLKMSHLHALPNKELKTLVLGASKNVEKLPKRVFQKLNFTRGRTMSQNSSGHSYCSARNALTSTL